MAEQKQTASSRAVNTHLGKPYVWGTTGPNSFDCSGLVYRAFRQAKLARKIGGFNTAHGYFYDFRSKAGRAAPTPDRATSWSGTTVVMWASTWARVAP